MSRVLNINVLRVIYNFLIYSDNFLKVKVTFFSNVKIDRSVFFTNMCVH